MLIMNIADSNKYFSRVLVLGWKLNGERLVSFFRIEVGHGLSDCTNCGRFRLTGLVDVQPAEDQRTFLKIKRFGVVLSQG